MEELEQYMNEDLDEETRDRIAARLAQDPDLAVELLLLEGLSQWRYQEIVGRAAATRHGMRAATRRLFAIRSIAAAATLLIAGSVFFFKKNQPDPGAAVAHAPTSIPAPDNPRPLAADVTPSPAPPEPSQPKTIPKTIPKTTPKTAPQAPTLAQKPAPTPEKTPEQRRPRQTAEAPAESVPTRGKAPQTDSPSLLPLVGAGAYPPEGWQPGGRWSDPHEWIRDGNPARAYGALSRLERKQPSNDTLLLMKAYCLIELGEGRKAMEYLKRIDTKTESMQAVVEWYRGLSMAADGKRPELEALLQNIAKQPRHPYRQAAQSALDQLRQ
ncbi:MAG: hypothetical protein ACK4NS_12720 [Saprospiraceae bacterium]